LPCRACQAMWQPIEELHQMVSQRGVCRVQIATTLSSPYFLYTIISLKHSHDAARYHTATRTINVMYMGKQIDILFIRASVPHCIAWGKLHFLWAFNWHSISSSNSVTPPGIEVLDGRKLGPSDVLFCLDHIEGAVVILAPHCQVSDLLICYCTEQSKSGRSTSGKFFTKQGLLEQNN
jgi:hypothetical protein